MGGEESYSTAVAVLHIGMWSTELHRDPEAERREEDNLPGFPPDVWWAHMIDGICLLLY